MGGNALLVTRRELRSYFLSPVGYIVIALFVAISGAIFFLSFFIDERTEMRDFFTLLPWILAVAAPAITMRLFSEEYRSGTYEITRTHPFTLEALVFGKYLAALFFLAVMLLPTLSFPIFVSAIGELDWGPVVGGYVGALFLAAAFAAIGLLTSALSKNLVTAYVMGALVSLFFALIDQSLRLLPGALSGTVHYLSAGSHFENIAKGIFDSRDLIYFLSLPALALYLTMLVTSPTNPRNRDGKRVALQAGAHASFLVFIAVVNAVSGSFHARIDLTRDKIFSLSPVSTDTIESLRQPVTVRAFFSRNLPVPYNSVEQRLRDLLASYSLVNTEYFNYSIYPMTKPEETLSVSFERDLSKSEKLAQDYSIFPVQIQEVERDEVKLTNAYMGIAIVFGDSYDTISAATSPEKLEYSLTSSIRRLTEKSSRLLSLAEPIEIELFLSNQLYDFPEFVALREMVEENVGAMGSDYYQKLSFSTVDPSTDETKLEAARALQLAPLLLSGEDGQPIEAFASVALRLEENDSALNLVQFGPGGYQTIDPELFDQALRTALDTLITPQLSVGYVVGNGSQAYRGRGTPRSDGLIEPNLVDFFPLVTREYEIRGFFAKNGVPDGVRAVIVADPKEEFSDYDLFQIDQFLMSGGSLALFLSGNDIYINDAGAFFVPRETGIEALIEHYGVRLTQNYLLDESSFVFREVDQRGSVVEIPIYSAPIFREEQFHPEMRFLDNIADVVFTNIAPLVLSEGLPTGVTARPLLVSSENAWVIEGDLNLNSPLRTTPPPEGLRSMQTVAYLLEGTFESFFNGRDLPERPTAGGADDAESGAEIALADTFLPESSGGKLLVFGTTAPLGDNVLDAEGDLPASRMLLSILDYLNGLEGVAEMRVKGSHVPRLPETTPFVKGFTRYFNTAGLALVVVLCGAVVWLLNRARLKRVQRSFSKARR